MHVYIATDVPVYLGVVVIRSVFATFATNETDFLF